MLQLIARDLFENHLSRETANSGFDRYRNCQRHVLLVPADSLSPGRGRLQLGDSGGEVSVGREKSVRHAARTVSDDRSFIRIAIRMDASRSRGRRLLWHQFSAAGFRPHTLWLPPVAGVSCISLLGRDSDRAVVTTDRSQRFLSSPASRNHGQTTNWFTSRADSFDPARSHRMCCGDIAEPGGNAAMAILMDGATRILRALHTLAGFARAFAGAWRCGVTAIGMQFCYCWRRSCRRGGSSTPSFCG